MLILRPIFALFRSIEMDRSRAKLVLGVLWGLMMGFSPVLSLQFVAGILLLFMLRMNYGTAILGSIVGLGLHWLLKPLSHEIGVYLLTQVGGLQWYWSRLFHLPIIPYTHFYNTVVMGSLMWFLFFSLVTLIFLPPFLKNRGRNFLNNFLTSRIGRWWLESSLHRRYVQHNEQKRR